MDTFLPVADTVGITAFRNNISKYFQLIMDREMIIVTKSWHRGVLINKTDYNDLLELLEYLLGETTLSEAMIEKRQNDTQKLMKKLSWMEEFFESNKLSDE